MLRLPCQSLRSLRVSVSIHTIFDVSEIPEYTKDSKIDGYTLSTSSLVEHFPVNKFSLAKPQTLRLPNQSFRSVLFLLRLLEVEFMVTKKFIDAR